MSKQPAEVPFQILDLSVDLLLSVADFLDPPSAACFSLACKDLYYIHHLRGFWPGKRPRKPRTRIKYPDKDDKETKIKNDERNKLSREMIWNDRIEFLRRLETNFPNMTLCAYCCKFHSQEEFPENADVKTCKNSKGPWLWWPQWEYGIHLEDIYQVMLRHRLGEPYGKPLDSLSYWTPWAPHPRARASTNLICQRKLDVTPQIVNGMLTIQVCQRILWGGGRASRELRYQLIREGSRICDPTYLNGNCGENVPLSWWEIFWLLFSIFEHLTRWSALCLRVRKVFYGRFHRCGDCKRDWTYTAWNHGQKGHEVAFDTWINLGKCDFNQEWQKSVFAAVEGPNSQIDEAIGLGVRNGSVRDHTRLQRSKPAIGHSSLRTYMVGRAMREESRRKKRSHTL